MKTITVQLQDGVANSLLKASDRLEIPLDLLIQHFCITSLISIQEIYNHPDAMFVPAEQKLPYGIENIDHIKL